MIDSAIDFLNGLSVCTGYLLLFPAVFILQFTGLEEVQNLAGEDVCRPIQVRSRNHESCEICVS